MDIGTRRLARSAAAYAACLSFPLVYLLSASVGASGMTAVWRGGLAAAGVYFFGRLLFYPLADTLLSAIAESERRRREAEE